jgi:hypothetical protein
VANKKKAKHEETDELGRTYAVIIAYRDTLGQDDVKHMLLTNCGSIETAIHSAIGQARMKPYAGDLGSSICLTATAVNKEIGGDHLTQCAEDLKDRLHAIRKGDEASVRAAIEAERRGDPAPETPLETIELVHSVPRPEGGAE